MYRIKITTLIAFLLLEGFLSAVIIGLTVESSIRANEVLLAAAQKANEDLAQNQETAASLVRTLNHGLSAAAEPFGSFDRAFADALGRLDARRTAKIGLGEGTIAEAEQAALIDRLRSRGLEPANRLLAEAKREQAMGTLLTEAIPLLDALRDASNAVAQDDRSRQQRAMDELTAGRETLRTRVLLTTAVSALLFIALGIMIRSVIRRQLADIERATGAFARGDTTARCNILGMNDLGIIGAGFNAMAEKIGKALELERLTKFAIVAATGELSTTIREQEATIAEQATSAIEVSATSREVAATSAELARSMLKLSATVADMNTLSGQGGEGVVRLETALGSIGGSAASMSGKLGELHQRAAAISAVLSTITKVADKINILSLNAAIEAEKAGDQGRGFAVVADEVRRLADQTDVAALDIERIVKDIQSAVSSSVMGMDRFNEEIRKNSNDAREIVEIFGKLMAAMQATAPQFESMSDGAQQQAQASADITAAVTRTSDLVSMTSEAMVAARKAVERLDEAAVDQIGTATKASTQQIAA